MAVFLTVINAGAAFVLFFSMSGITDWVIYSSTQAKVFPFILGIELLVNAVYLGLTQNGMGVRRGG